MMSIFKIYQPEYRREVPTDADSFEQLWAVAILYKNEILLKRMVPAFIQQKIINISFAKKRTKTIHGHTEVGDIFILIT